MGQEDKKLLLKDLCARLPYNCRVFYEYIDNLDNKTYGYSLTLNTWCINEFIANKAVIKPYLRPMSSITEKEILDLQKINCQFSFNKFDNYAYVGATDDGFCSVEEMSNILDYLNSKHFDYHGLIEKGLALEASEEICNLKEKV